MAEPEDWVRTGTAARALGIDRVTLWRAANSDPPLLQPAGVTPGGHLLWDLDDLRRQLAERAAP